MRTITTPLQVGTLPHGGPSGPRPRAGLYDLFRLLSDLARALMRLFALALNQPEQFFDDKIDKHISRLRVRNYPAPTVSPKPGQLAPAPIATTAASRSADQDKPGGLQV